MATLPNPEEVQVDTEFTRKMGIGTWRPEVIGRAYNEAAAGLEKLGAGMGNFGADLERQQQQDQEKTNQLQVAQARGALYANTTKALTDAQASNDPNAIANISQGLPNMASGLAGKIQDPRTAALFQAETMPHLAEVTGRLAGLQRNLTNRNAIADYDTQSNSIIDNAATVDDDTASVKMLDGVKGMIGPLVSSGAWTAPEGVEAGVRASDRYTAARSNYLLAQASATRTPQAYARFSQFSGLDPKMFGLSQENGQWSFTPGSATPPPVSAPGTGAPQADSATFDRSYYSSIPKASDPYAKVPPVGEHGEDQLSRFRQWNNDPVGNSSAILNTVHPDLQAVVRLAQKENPNLPFVVALGKNTAEQQNLAKSWGWSEVGAGPDAKHMQGLVVDLWPVDNQGHVVFDKGRQEQINGAMQRAAGELGQSLRWGGLAGEGGQNKNFRDAPNFQLLNPRPWDKAQGAPLAGPTNEASIGEGNVPTGAPEHGASRIPSAGPYEGTINAAAQKYGLPPDVLKRQIWQESRFDPSAVGPPTRYGTAKGIAQFIDTTAKDYGVDVHDPNSSINGAARYMADLRQKFGGNLGMALAAYNWGPGNLSLWLQDPSRPVPKQTLDYVKGITGQSLEAWRKDPNLQFAISYPDIVTRQYGARPANLPFRFPMPVGLPVAPPIGGEPFSGMAPPADGRMPSIAPPQSQWPKGAESIAVNDDGTMDYVMSGGGRQPAPGSQATGMPWMPLPPPPAGSVAGMLPADKRAEMQLRALNDIRRMQRQDQVASQRDDRADLANITATVKQMEGGAQLVMDNGGWSKMRAGYANSASPAVRYQFAVADAVRSQLQDFWGASPASVSATVANLKGAYNELLAKNPTDPRLDVIGSVVQSAENYAKAYDQDMKKSPLRRAAAEGQITDLKPLDPGSQTLANDVAERVEQAHAAAQFFKTPDVPYLLPEDRIAFRRVAAQGGDAMVSLAKGIVAGAGLDAPQFFKQIGGDAPAFQSIGELALDPNNDNSVTINRIAHYIAAENDKNASKSLPRFNQSVVAKNGEDPLGDAYAGFGPDATARLRTTAQILMGDEAFTNGHDPARGDAFGQKFFDRAYTEALGGHVDDDGNRWGGPHKAGNAHDWYTTIVPTNVRGDRFDSIIGQLTNEDIAKMAGRPVTEGGKTIDASMLQRGQFKPMPDKHDGLFHGRYVVTLPNAKGDQTPVLQANGQPWVFDFNRLDQGDKPMRNRLPDAYLPTAIPRSPPNYQRTPGVISEGETVAEGGPVIGGNE